MTTQEQLLKLPVCNETLYKKVAARTGISPKQVEELVMSVSKFTAKTIKRGAFDTIMIPSFGKFKVKEKQIQKIEQLKAEGVIK
jgi:nucleoid DNA-binding protein